MKKGKIAPSLLKSIFFLCLFYLLSHSLIAQYAEFDSLNKLLIKDKFKNDSAKLNVYDEIIRNSQLDSKKRLKYGLEALKIAKKPKNSIWLYPIQYRLGHIYKKIGNLEDALFYYLEALKLAKKQEDIRRQSLMYSALGTLYRVSEDYDKAIKYYSLGIESLRDGNNKIDSTNLAKSLMNAGEFYRIIGKYDSALIYFEESGKIFQEVEFLMGTAYTIGNMGLVHAQKGEHRIAKNKMDLATVILRDMGDFYPIAVYDLYIADIYKENNDLERAIEYAEHSLTIAQEHSLKEQIRDANLKLSELYDDQNDYQKAYFHQSQYLVYRDSINSEEKIREIADMRTEYEVNQREAEIQLLKAEQKNKYAIFASMAIIILLLAILSILYYRNSRKKQKLNSLLEERKEEIEAQRDQLEGINETREKFLSIIAHDLMGPVNSFKGLSAIMKMSILNQDLKDLHDIHAVFDKTISNLSTLLTNLLDWSVTQQGKIPYQPERILLKKLIGELTDLFFNMTQAKKISLESNILDKYFLWADVNSVNTLLRNLVSNSLKFTEEGGEITLSAEKSNPFILIKVSDSGIGMPQSKIDLLIDENHFEISKGTKGEAGVGLGLQLVKEFVKMNQGKMEIKSEVDEGTTFYIYLPDYDSLAP
ncbi:tetratricopeptide repeat-containing sensor histidine kinase [Marivirga sp.]|uniref:tetratricopeptide repeat-containing sensor histidine kinase n=1 Tax=Marivirga sp. TaxID=2018662 RepID=UPI0025F0C2DE|nr:tetratricopeptide repeat-containing sensor histidine kinase [Marivirga sp.]